jgi:glyoxylase-like metal-dependent hydrolase (beta-lactamase superfamily II)
VLGAALLPASPAHAQGAARITTTDLGGGLKLLQGAGANVLALAGPEGALMIDGGLTANADALLAAVRTATGASRIHTLINTHGHAEQVGANEAVGRAGGVIFAHEKTQKYLSNSVESVFFKGPPQAAAASGEAHQDHARRGLDGVRRPADRLRLSARRAY